MKAKRVLFVGAHPDDIEFYCGATVKWLTSRKTAVMYLIATKGSHRLPGFVGRYIKKRRVSDQSLAARKLGVKDITFLDIPDGSVTEFSAALVQKISAMVDIKHPDIVLSWDPVYTYNPHPDHVATGRALVDSQTDASMLFYGTTKPDTFVAVDNSLLKSKMQALQCHRTEVPWFLYYYHKCSVIKRLKQAGKQSNNMMAECFRSRQDNVSR